MKRHQELVDIEAQAEHFKRSQRDREAGRGQLAEKMKEMPARKRKECLDWLSSTDISTPKDEALSKRTPGTGPWLLRLPELSGLL